MDIGSQRGPVGGTSEVQERRGRGEEEDSCVISGQMQKRQLPRSQGATGQRDKAGPTAKTLQGERPCRVQTLLTEASAGTRDTREATARPAERPNVWTLSPPQPSVGRTAANTESTSSAFSVCCVPQESAGPYVPICKESVRGLLL